MNKIDIKTLSENMSNTYEKYQPKLNSWEKLNISELWDLWITNENQVNLYMQQTDSDRKKS